MKLKSLVDNFYQAHSELTTLFLIYLQLNFSRESTCIFRYALTDCKASGANGASPVTLYGGTGAASAYCPNTASAIVKLNKVDSSQFKLNLFRIGQETSLTFTCTVKVFPKDDLPTDATTCTGVAGRKRRAAMARQQARQQDEEVEVVVQLAESENKATGSAAETCANIVIPTLFLASLF